MCSRSTGVMLSQNRRGWLKWSSKLAAACRTVRQAGTSRGTSMYTPSPAPARYENSRPASSGSSVMSMPGTRCPGWKATCSVSAK